MVQVAQAKSANTDHAQQKTDSEQNSRKDRKKAQKSVNDTSFLPGIAEEKSEALAEAFPAAKNDLNLDNKAEAIQNETAESIMFRKFDAFVDDAVFFINERFQAFFKEPLKSFSIFDFKATAWPDNNNDDNQIFL